LSLDEAVAYLASRAGVTAAICAVEEPGRAAERRAGDRAARRSLELAGGVGPIGRQPDGRPRWPSGWVGSIAHAGRFGVAAVSRLTDHRTVGVDLEHDGALEVDDARLVLTPAELRWVLACSQPERAATLVWSAKESAFKAWSSASGGLYGVDPLDVHIDVQADTNTLAASAGGALANKTYPLAGAYATASHMVVTLLTDLPSSQRVDGHTQAELGG
jgi:4'-phosphopantetheinyl transferase EntD